MLRGEVLFKGQGDSIFLKVIELNIYSINRLRKQKGRNKGIQVVEEESFVFVVVVLGYRRELQKYFISDREGIRGVDSDGLLSDKKLGEFQIGEFSDQNFSSKVVQRGREFFDSNGNFLYRI